MNSLVEHDVPPEIASRNGERMKQISEQMFLPEHQTTRLVDPQPLVEPEVFLIGSFVLRRS
jgi:hypothetical protein